MKPLKPISLFEKKEDTMTDQERLLIQQLHDLQVKLFDLQGAEIEALQQAISRSREVVAQMAKVTADLLHGVQ
jgi:hypothetical protein